MEIETKLLESYGKGSCIFIVLFLSISFLKDDLDARLLSRSLRQRSDKPLVGHYCGGRVWSICLPFIFTLYLDLLFFCILHLNLYSAIVANVEFV